MSVMIEGAAIPDQMDSMTSSLSNKQIEDLRMTRVIFFAGNDVNFTSKNEMPSVKGFGGVYMPHLKTLPKQNKGMVYRCQLTALTTSKIIENRMMIPPGERENGQWESGFIQTNAVRNADGSYSDKEVRGFQGSDPNATKQGQFSHLLDSSQMYKNRYPGEDVRMAIKRSQPHGPGGVVEVTALMGATSEEIYAAQLFFFPNWVEIRKGNFALPETMRGLEDHIKERMAAINTLPTDMQGTYRSIGNAMLRSCTEYRVAYTQTFQKNEIVLKDAAARGHTGAAFPESAEEAMAMLEVKRKDDLVSGESSSVDRLARIMEKKEAGESALELRKLEIEERKLAIEEVKLGLRKPEDVPQVVTPVIEVAPPEPQFIEDEVTGQVSEALAPGYDGSTYIPHPHELAIADSMADATDPEYSIGDKIMLESGEAEVIARPFGRPKVRLASGEEVMLDKL